MTDAVGEARTPDGTRGHQVIKFSPTGAVLMTLGTPGEAGSGNNSFNAPADVVVANNGDIFVADGHGDNTNNRVVKFSKDGTFIKSWGRTGYGPGEFRTLHAIAMDAEGRIYVGDRSNNRIQIFDQEGTFLAQWTQFGRQSGIFFDDHGRIYVADSESDDLQNPGWEMGDPDRGGGDRLGHRVHTLSVGGSACGSAGERRRVRGGGPRRHHLWRRAAAAPGSEIRTSEAL